MERKRRRGGLVVEWYERRAGGFWNVQDARQKVTKRGNKKIEKLKDY